MSDTMPSGGEDDPSGDEIQTEIKLKRAKSERDIKSEANHAEESNCVVVFRVHMPQFPSVKGLGNYIAVDKKRVRFHCPS